MRLRLLLTYGLVPVSAVAAVLALVAAFSFALAATLWQRASMDAGVGPGDARGLVGLLTNGVWLLGLGAQGLGVALQAAALDRGRVAIIQPLLVTSIVWALPLGYLLTNQTITRRHSPARRSSSSGSPCSRRSATRRPASTTRRRRTGSPRSGDRRLCIALIILGEHGGLGTKAAVFGATAGALYGVSATLMKPVVETWHADGARRRARRLAVLGHGRRRARRLLPPAGIARHRQVGHVGGDCLVVNPVVSVLLGALVLQERLDKNPEWHTVVAIGALATAMLGAVIIASASEHEPDTVQLAVS